MRLRVFLALLLFLGVPPGFAQLASPFSNSVWPSQTFTATGQTGTTIQLNGLVVSSTVGSSFASGTVTLTGSSLTTVTFSVLGSSDNGATFYPLQIYTQSSPSTAPATTVTATANGLYQVSLAGVTHVKFVTSGTFTATAVSLVLTASPNVSVAKGSSSGSGLPTGFTANPGTGIFTAPNGYAISSGQQVVNNYTAGTTPTAPPTHTVQFGAPPTVPSSYNAYLPSAPPADAQGDVYQVPQGGGLGTWVPPASIVLISRQTLSAPTSVVTFSGIPQTYSALMYVQMAGTTGGTAKWGVLNFNGDTNTSDYFNTWLNVSFSAGGSTTPTGYGSFSAAGNFVPVDASTTWIYHYTSTSGFNIASQGTAGGSLIGLGITNDIWAGSAAATSFTVKTDDGTTFTTGSQFILYGVI